MATSQHRCAGGQKQHIARIVIAKMVLVSVFIQQEDYCWKARRTRGWDGDLKVEEGRRGLARVVENSHLPLIPTPSPLTLIPPSNSFVCSVIHRPLTNHPAPPYSHI